jgi:hypothetical protein
MTGSVSASMPLPEAGLRLQFGGSGGAAAGAGGAGGVTLDGARLRRFLPHTIDEDQYQSTGRVLYWSWRKYASGRPRAGNRNKGDTPKVNIIGPIYSMFKSATNPAEVRRPIEGIGVDVNLFFPMGNQLADTDRLSDADANVCMCIAYESARIRPISGSGWAHQNQGEGATQKAGAEANIVASARAAAMKSARVRAILPAPSRREPAAGLMRGNAP